MEHSAGLQQFDLIQRNRLDLKDVDADLRVDQDHIWRPGGLAGQARLTQQGRFAVVEGTGQDCQGPAVTIIRRIVRADDSAAH